MNIRTRFSPSPTGFLHLGGARTALYNWLFAKKNKGKFVLRIEDTDNFRGKKNAVENILSSLSWLGLTWDEGPYYQSNRLKIYKKYIKNLLNSGLAYKCFCSAERLEKIRKKLIIQGKKPCYDKKCRNLSFNGLVKKFEQPYVIRFKNPDSGYVVFKDIIRGEIIFQNSELDDLIIQRTDGNPTYNFCVVVDDHEMNITHVLRGEDHINNTPRQINLFHAINGRIPEYAHFSMILDENGKKLSKRNNAMSVLEFFNLGYFPEALLNYLVRLGWSYKNQEFFNVSEMIHLFDLKNVNNSPSKLNFKKILNLNHYYSNHLSQDTLKIYCKKFVNCNKFDKKFLKPSLYTLVKYFSKRHNILSEYFNEYIYLYEEINFNNNIFLKNFLDKKNLVILHAVYQTWYNSINWDVNFLSLSLKKISLNLNIDYKIIAMLIRFSLTGKKISPNISLIAFFLGQRKSLERILMLINILKNL